MFSSLIWWRSYRARRVILRESFMVSLSIYFQIKSLTKVSAHHFCSTFQGNLSFRTLPPNLMLSSLLATSSVLGKGFSSDVIRFCFQNTRFLNAFLRYLINVCRGLLLWIVGLRWMTIFLTSFAFSVFGTVLARIGHFKFFKKKVVPFNV